MSVLHGFSDEWLKGHEARMDRIRAAAGRPAPQAVANVPARVGCPIRSAPARAKPAHDEDDLQILVAEFLDRGLPEPLRWMHIPNGGHRFKAVAGKLKAMGVKKGAADVLILGFHPFIWIELKTDEGSLTPEQRDWRDWCRTIGAPWFLCRSLDDVIDALESLQIRLKVRA